MSEKRIIIEVTPLNDLIYTELSIEELERRLEIQKLHITNVDATGAYACGCDNK